jgi:hypothetical protein
LNALATGELLRAAIGRRHFWFIVRKDHNWLLCLLVNGWWIALALALALPAMNGRPAIFAAGGILLLPFVAMSLRWRSVRLGLYSVTAWNVFALCFWPGLLRPRNPPTDWIESTLLQDSSPRAEPARLTREAPRALGRERRSYARDADKLNTLQ